MLTIQQQDVQSVTGSRTWLTWIGHLPDKNELRVGLQNLKTRWLVSLTPLATIPRTSSPMSSGLLYPMLLQPCCHTQSRPVRRPT